MNQMNRNHHLREYIGKDDSIHIKNQLPNISLGQLLDFVGTLEKQNLSNWANANVYSKDIEGVSQVMENYSALQGSITSIQDWQKEILLKIKDNKNTDTIYIFDDTETRIWIAIEDSSTEHIEPYMNIYADFLINNDQYFDIFVFDIKDTCNYKFPENAIILKRN